jgi:hypothetical protein
MENTFNEVKFLVLGLICAFLYLLSTEIFAKSLFALVFLACVILTVLGLVFQPEDEEIGRKILDRVLGKE